VKAKQRLARQRKREDLKERLKLNSDQLALTAKWLKLTKKQYERTMIELWHDSTENQRAALEEIYQRTAGCSLRSVYKQHIITLLQSQPRRRL
jgi:hypothetical protein